MKKTTTLPIQTPELPLVYALGVRMIIAGMCFAFVCMGWIIVLAVHQQPESLMFFARPHNALALVGFMSSGLLTIPGLLLAKFGKNPAKFFQSGEKIESLKHLAFGIIWTFVLNPGIIAMMLRIVQNEDGEQAKEILVKALLNEAWLPAISLLVAFLALGYINHYRKLDLKRKMLLLGKVK